jgi:hypothetical protein
VGEVLVAFKFGIDESRKCACGNYILLSAEKELKRCVDCRDEARREYDRKKSALRPYQRVPQKFCSCGEAISALSTHCPPCQADRKRRRSAEWERNNRLREREAAA